MSEVREILNCLGRSSRDSEVRDTHLSLVLNHLQMEKRGDMKKTLAKLTLICGMGKRNVRENYLEGLIAFDIIQTRIENNTEIWNWNGIKAFRKNGDST